MTYPAYCSTEVGSTEVQMLPWQYFPGLLVFFKFFSNSFFYSFYTIIALIQENDHRFASLGVVVKLLAL